MDLSRRYLLAPTVKLLSHLSSDNRIIVLLNASIGGIYCKKEKSLLCAYIHAKLTLQCPKEWNLEKAVCSAVNFLGTEILNFGEWLFEL